MTAWVVLIAAGISFCFLFYYSSRYEFRWSAVWPYRFNLLRGWFVTLGIAAGSLVLSSVLGAILTMAQMGTLQALRFFARAYVELIRGTPLLVQLLIGFYIVAPVFGLHNPALVGILLLSTFAAAYLSEIFRGGIESVARSQIDSARAVGFTTPQTYRYVIAPQAIRNVLPAVAGQFANLIKDSSLLSVIAVTEFTKQAENTSSSTFAVFESYLPLAVGYLILTLPISWYSRKMEEKLKYDH